MKFYDDDMDDLFNKAGRDYPLKTDPKNWDAVHAALQPENDAGVTQKRNGWRRLLPLLFLLLIPAVYVFVDKDNIKTDSKVSPAEALATDPGSTDNSISNSQKSLKSGDPKVTKEATANTNTIIHLNKERSISPEKQVPISNSKELIIDQNKEGSVGLKEEGRINESNQLIKANKGIENNSLIENNQRIERTNDIMSDKKIEVKDEETIASRLSGNKPYFWNSIPSLNTQFNLLNDPSEVIALNTPLRSLNQSSEQKSVPNSDKKTKNRKGPYIGVIASPDLSMIKGQNVKGIGYSAGAIIGYTFSNRWQVEGGALWSRKRYYTDGKYFDTKAAQIPQNVNVYWLDGGCNMFEFPIVARYNFSEKRNTFFGSAGLTSYLMKKEDYNYKAQVGGGGYTYEGYRKYDRSGDHLFANLQLSAGYNFSLSSKLNIRIEPYLKAPLKKIGIGKMPITSTGLYFAITRDFH
jgi:hypothetical protein